MAKRKVRRKGSIDKSLRKYTGKGFGIATLRKVKLVQSSANVLIVGYVHVKRLGKTSVNLALNVDEFLTVT